METGQEPMVGKRSQLNGMLPQTDMLLGTHAAAADEWPLLLVSFATIIFHLVYINSILAVFRFHPYLSYRLL